MAPPVYPLVKPKGRAFHAVRRAVVAQVAAGVLIQLPRMVRPGDAQTSGFHAPVFEPPAMPEPYRVMDPIDGGVAAAQAGPVPAGVPSLSLAKAGEKAIEAAASQDFGSAFEALAPSLVPGGTPIAGAAGSLATLVASGKGAVLAGALVAFGAGYSGLYAVPGSVTRPLATQVASVGPGPASPGTDGGDGRASGGSGAGSGTGSGSDRFYWPDGGRGGSSAAGVAGDGAGSNAGPAASPGGGGSAGEAAQGVAGAGGGRDAALLVPAGLGAGPGDVGGTALTEVVEVPEPGTLLIVGWGAAASIAARRRLARGVPGQGSV